jgi:hypothetical protein
VYNLLKIQHMTINQIIKGEYFSLLIICISTFDY